MKKNGALLLAGLFFAVVSLVHLLRLIFSIEIIVAGYAMPQWVSVVGLVISLLLCILMFMARRNKLS